LHILSVCVYNLSYPACNAHVPCCHLWPIQHYQIFFALPHKWHDFQREVIEHKMCVLIFSTNFVWNVCHSKKDWGRYFMHIQTSSCKIPIILSSWIISTDFRKLLK